MREKLVVFLDFIPDWLSSAVDWVMELFSSAFSADGKGDIVIIFLVLVLAGLIFFLFKFIFGDLE